MPTTANTRRKGTQPRLSREGEGVWTAGEHARFLEAMELYPHGPWKLVAAHIGTRTTRQAMTHAQKYRQKLERRRRGLRNTQSKRLNIDQLPARPTSEEMVSFEHLMPANVTAVGDWYALEPMPLTILQNATEPAWADDCFRFFVDTFSCDQVV